MVSQVVITLHGLKNVQEWFLSSQHVHRPQHVPGHAWHVPGHAWHVPGHAWHVPGHAWHVPGHAWHVPGHAWHVPGHAWPVPVRGYAGCVSAPFQMLEQLSIWNQSQTMYIYNKVRLDMHLLPRRACLLTKAPNLIKIISPFRLLINEYSIRWINLPQGAICTGACLNDRRTRGVNVASATPAAAAATSVVDGASPPPPRSSPRSAYVVVVVVADGAATAVVHFVIVSRWMSASYSAAKPVELHPTWCRTSTINAHSHAIPY